MLLFAERNEPGLILMRRADRLLQIIQIFRRKSGPVTARQIASELEVARRTIYRDIVSLVSSGVPLRGEAGVGYILEDGYDLPPLMFTTDELEALMLGARLVSSHGNTALTRSANDAIAKIATVIPDDLRPVLLEASLYAPEFGGGIIDTVDVSTIRNAIRSRKKLNIVYADAKGQGSQRVLWPIVLAYHRGVRLVAAWCELRTDFRHFRVDRMREISLSEEKIPERYDLLFSRWKKGEIEKRGEFILVSDDE